MARIAGIDLPQGKRAEIGLTYIYGIGRARSLSILHRAGISPDKKVKDLTEEEVTRIRQILEEEGNIEGDLRKEVALSIRRLSKSAHTGVSGIAGICLCGGSEPILIHGPVKGLARVQSPTRGRQRGRHSQSRCVGLRGEGR